MSFDMTDYVDVKARIALFYAKYPEGTLQFSFLGVLKHDPDMIWGIAYAYRTPDDTKPAIGHAQELATGKTSFTRGSELQNLETSAIGRAIGMLGLGIETSLASKDEVQHAKARQSDVKPRIPRGPAHGQPAINDPATEAQLKLIQRIMPGPAWVTDWKVEQGITGAVNKAQASKLIEVLTAMKNDAKEDSKEDAKFAKDYPRTTDGD